MPVNGIQPGGQNTELTGQSRLSDATEDSDQFMKILLEQLKQQDPMNPKKSGKFVSQMAELTSLEKMSSLSKNVEQFTNQQSTNQYLNLLGSNVEVTTKDSEKVSGVVESVKYSKDGARLSVGGSEVDSSNIMEVSLPGINQ